MKSEEFGQDLMGVFASIENRLRKDNITDSAQWAKEFLTGMKKLGQEWGFSACEKPGIFSDADWGEWCFEIIWTKDDGPVKNNKENSRPTVSLMVHETRKLGDAIIEGFRAPVRVFDGRKPGDSYELEARYEESRQGEWSQCRGFGVDEANNSVYRYDVTMSYVWGQAE